MPRNITNEKEAFNISSYKILNARVRTHVAETQTSVTDFTVRALINQLEREGDYSIRDMMREAGILNE